MISLKTDIATKMHRSVMGINYQKIGVDGTFQKRTLAVLELNTRHTAVNLKEELYKVLAEYGIDLKQIYSITIVNGRKMVKMTQLIEKDTLEDDMDDDGDDDIRTSTDDGSSDDGAIKGLLDDLEDAIRNQAVGIRCGAHTTQLVVSDACKAHHSEISAITKVVTAMRNTRYKTFFDLSSAKFPPIPTPTRWGSQYSMMLRLAEQKDIFVKLGDEFEELNLDELWNFVDSYVEAFKPLNDCTVAIQR
ncbi:uncharacterized protein LOC134218246 [Armigeres subalbatus]|uniref:uncharacterized protein LOC134218246 n=1 Tax=Armigeres subalbatus TaxID=124917 RepID=UPI002ED14035